MKLRLEELDNNSIENDDIPLKWRQLWEKRRNNNKPIERIPAQKRKNSHDLNQTFQVKQRKTDNDSGFVDEDNSNCEFVDTEDVVSLTDCPTEPFGWEFFPEDLERVLKQKPNIVENAQGKFDRFYNFCKFTL